MTWLLFAIALVALCASSLPVFLARRFVRDVLAMLRMPSDRGYRPKVSLVVPCKGLDPSFETNIRACLAQDHPDLEVLFVTATRDDPAYTVLTSILRAHPDVRATLLVAGLASGRSEKVNNQLKAVSEVRGETEVIVFMDSDARPNSAFVRHLVQPLADGAIGLATGFRWYMPVAGGVWSFLRSAWNGGGVVFVTDPQANYAWGGAMAIRRETFVACQVVEHWQRALSDDMTITLAVREQGLGIAFVPRCLVTTYEDCSFGQMWEWTNRQTIIAKVYHPPLWWKIAIAHCMGNLILLIGLGLLIARVFGVYHDPVILAASLAMLSIIPMEMLNAKVLMPAILQMLPEHRESLDRHYWRYCVLAPSASLLALANTIYSMFTSRIAWRGVVYDMRSPTETVIVSKRS